MPTAPAIACPCGGRRTKGQPCPRCGAGKRKTKEQGGWVSSPLYRTARWQNRRDFQLRSEPLCRMCMDDGICTAATVADHVTPWATEEEFFNGELQSLCYTHHGRKSAGERR